MATDLGLAPPQERSSSEQRLHGHSLCQNHLAHEVFFSYSRMQSQFLHDLDDEFRKCSRFLFNKPFFDVRDESLRTGEEWSDPLIKAARNCKVAVLILTKDYLTSYWAMLELLLFVDALKDNPDMKLIPVFYDALLPSDLDDQAIDYRWKMEWEKKMEWAKDTGAGSSAKLGKVSFTVESCKKALQILKNMSGIKSQDYQSFGLMRKDILSKVLKYLPSGFGAEMDSKIEGCHRLCDIISGMFREYDEGKECLGLYGMGGSGKTTMCKALCRYFAPAFNHKTYYLKIGSNDCKSQEKLLERHKALLKSNLIGLSQEEIDRYPEPSKDLKYYLEQQPVFLAVDDVQGDLNSWEEVQTYMSYLCRGSKIIITARSRSILKNICNPAIHCERIPNLNGEEALSLFFKIVAPERKLASLDGNEDRILRACLKKNCSFTLEEADGDSHVSSEVGHYHPLALRAFAFYFRKQFLKLDNIEQCGLELLNKKRDLLFASDTSVGIFDILGIGFHEICSTGKQLFIDLALYAPRADSDEDLFKWLVDINFRLSPEVICMKLKDLREMSFLNCEDKDSACTNINMHDLYREYAKKFVNKHENEHPYKYGVCNDHHYQAPIVPSSGWKNTPRIRLKRWADAIEEKEWYRVSVIHLVHCETITTFQIGLELKDNLRELKVRHCSNLKQLNWAPDVISKQLVGGFKLCFVELKFNERLEILPDFSGCSELRQLAVTECSSSVMPIKLHSCASLQKLRIWGKNAPAVQSLRSCSKLGSVQLAWNASHKDLLVSNLPSLLELTVAGSSVLPTDYLAHECIVPHGLEQFRQQYPDGLVRYKLTGISELTNLRTLHLNFIPLGGLPEELRTCASTSLEDLNLRGCLLNDVVDVSCEFPNLRYLSIAQTNVKELRGTGGLKTLERLDCRFNFQLRKIPDLRPSARLKHVLLHLCPKLQAIPRIPPSCCENLRRSEDEQRVQLAADAFARTTKSAIPRPRFALFRDRTLPPSTTSKTHPPTFNTTVNTMIKSGPSLSRAVPNPIPHPGVQCYGCMIYPLIGPRYIAKNVRTTLDLCPKCFTPTCRRNYCNFTENSSLRTYRITQDVDLNYDLCHACFSESGCDDRDFYCGILLTLGNSVR